MFIKNWQLMFLYIGLMDWGAGHLTIIVGTGDGAFANERCPHPGFACPGVMLAAEIDSRMTFQFRGGTFDF